MTRDDFPADMTPEENEAVGAWLAGMTLGQYRPQGELYVGVAHTLYVIRRFREEVGRAGNEVGRLFVTTIRGRK